MMNGRSYNKFSNSCKYFTEIVTEFGDDYVYLELELESDSSSEEFNVDEFLNRVTTNTPN